ncbi:MAG: chromate transporter, partial [Opitutaceae bacterium]
LGAPHVEQLRGNVRLGTVLTTITASVVGVILNLAVWFGLHVFFPADRNVDAFAIAVAVVAFIVLQRFKVSVIPVVLASGIAGLLWKQFVLP